MATNEFRWGVKPAIPGHWRGTQMHDGFELEIADDWIEARKGNDGKSDAQQRRAQEIVEGIIRGIGRAEKTRFTAVLGSVSRFDPHSNRRDTNISLSGGAISAKASAHFDMTLTSADGTVVADSRRDRMLELLRLADAYGANATLRRMSDYLLDYHADPDKKLAPLFDVIELARKVWGGDEHKAATSLGIGIRRINAATKIMNDRTIRSGRHPGQELGAQRGPTPAETQLCEGVAEQIVSEYTKLVERGAAPR